MGSRLAGTLTSRPASWEHPPEIPAVGGGGGGRGEVPASLPACQGGRASVWTASVCTEHNLEGCLLSRPLAGLHRCRPKSRSASRKSTTTCSHMETNGEGCSRQGGKEDSEEPGEEGRKTEKLPIKRTH